MTDPTPETAPEGVNRTLSLRDRIYVAIARHVIARLTARVDSTQGRVWFVTVRSTRPRRRMWLPGQLIEDWPDGVTAGLVQFGIGGSEGEALDPPMIEMALTREMLDQLVDGVVNVRNLQDVQLKALRDT